MVVAELPEGAWQTQAAASLASLHAWDDCAVPASNTHAFVPLAIVAEAVPSVQPPLAHSFTLVTTEADAAVQFAADVAPAAQRALTAVDSEASRPLNASWPNTVPVPQLQVVLPAVLSTVAWQLGPSPYALKKMAVHRAALVTVVLLASAHAFDMAATYWSRTHGSSVQLCAAKAGWSAAKHSAVLTVRIVTAAPTIAIFLLGMVNIILTTSQAILLVVMWPQPGTTRNTVPDGFFGACQDPRLVRGMPAWSYYRNRQKPRSVLQKPRSVPRSVLQAHRSRRVAVCRGGYPAVQSGEHREEWCAWGQSARRQKQAEDTFATQP